MIHICLKCIYTNLKSSQATWTHQNENYFETYNKFQVIPLIWNITSMKMNKGLHKRSLNTKNKILIGILPVVTLLGTNLRALLLFSFVAPSSTSSIIDNLRLAVFS